MATLGLSGSLCSRRTGVIQLHQWTAGAAGFQCYSRRVPFSANFFACWTFPPRDELEGHVPVPDGMSLFVTSMPKKNLVRGRVLAEEAAAYR